MVDFVKDCIRQVLSQFDGLLHLFNKYKELTSTCPISCMMVASHAPALMRLSASAESNVMTPILTFPAPSKAQGPADPAL